MADISIVRLGPSRDNVSATLLRTALVSHFQKFQDNNTNNDNDNDNDNGGASLSEAIDDHTNSTLSICNKYFAAKILLEDIGTSKANSMKTSSSSSSSKEDGIILVFDALQSNPDRLNSASSSNSTFDALPIFHEEAQTKHSAGELLRLCVGVTLTAPSSAEEIRGQNADKEYSRRILWCLDRGYEYVEADLSQEGLSKGHQDRDKEGFARIVEAIEGTMWSSAKMSQRKTKELQKTYEMDKTSSQLAENDGLTSEHEKYVPPDPSHLGHLKLQTSDASQKAANHSETILDPVTVGSQEMADLRKDIDSDQLFDQMDQVLQQASKIRDASRAGEMSDEDRRNKASEAALALVNLMSQFGMDDEDDEDSVDVNSSDDDSGVVASSSR